MKKILQLIVVLSIANSVFAQDFHFSQFFASPMDLNPAMTGAIKGDWRVTGNYRSQWGWSSKVTPFQTVGAGYDMAILRNSLPGGDFIGIGGSFFSDQAGDAKFGSRQVGGYISYHKELSKSTPMFLSLGLRGTYSQVGFGKSPATALYFDSQYDPSFSNNYNQFALSGENFISTNRNIFDLSAGLMWYANLNEGFNVYAGAALSHLTSPKIQFLSGTATPEDAKIFRKLTLHAGAQIDLNGDVAFLPSFIILKQGPATEFNIGSFAKFNLGEIGAYEAAWSIGGWYRLGDAAVLATRIDYAHLSIGFSYDLNVSSLIKASKIAGGPELAIAYTGKLPKSTIGRGKILCPRF